MIIHDGFPHLWKVLTLIADDQGCPFADSDGCDMCNALKTGKWEVGSFSFDDVATADFALSQLTEQELEDFAIGEFTVVQKLQQRSSQLILAGRIVAAFFDGE